MKKELITMAILLLLFQPVLAEGVREDTALQPEEDMKVFILTEESGSEEQIDAGEIMTREDFIGLAENEEIMTERDEDEVPIMERDENEDIIIGEGQTIGLEEDGEIMAERDGDEDVIAEDNEEIIMAGETGEEEKPFNLWDAIVNFFKGILAVFGIK